MDQGIQSSDAYLMVGTVGLDNDEWQGGFYDEELPADWRMASYATLLRSVMLPAPEWKQAVAQAWADEVDDEFRFVLIADGQELDAIESLPQRLADRLGGIVMQYGQALNEDSLMARLAGLAEHYPICIDAGAYDHSQADVTSLCHKIGAGQVWHPEHAPEPQGGGSLLIAILTDQGLSEQRVIVTALERQLQAGHLAGVFHAPGSQAAERAQQTRLLAEMMGV